MTKLRPHQAAIHRCAECPTVLCVSFARGAAAYPKLRMKALDHTCSHMQIYEDGDPAGESIKPRLFIVGRPANTEP